jgi:predicted TIM-barrel fold metal-dependent hydrolase
VSELRMIDADCHYYEPDDAFTRHLEADLRPRALRIDRANNGRVMLGDERLGYFSVAVGDHVGPPGMLKQYFRSKGEFVGPDANGADALAVEAFTRRAARLQVIEQHRLEACLMLPSWGVGVEPELRAFPDLLHPSIRAFNRWVEEEWGFADGPIISAGLISMHGVEEAAAEIDRLAAAGCRVVCLTTGPVEGRSPADPFFDPIWARLQDHGMIAVHHIGANPFCELYATAWGERAHPPSHRHSALEMFFGLGERPIGDTWAALYLHNLFGRFPHLQVAAIEWGASWLPAVIDRLTKLRRAGTNKDSWRFGRPELDPLETFNRNQWIVPYYEDDIPALVAALGDTRLLAGSDYPHPEGLADPNEFAEELAGLPAETQQRILHDNGARLLSIA